MTTAGGNLVYGVPYHLAEATVEVGPEELRYRSRRDGEPVGHDITVHAGAWYTTPERSAGDDWLTGRWRAISVNAGVPLETYVEHEPWPLRRGRAVRVEENLLASIGLRRPLEDPIVHCADGVHVRLGPPRPLRG